MNVETVEKPQTNQGVQVISRAADILRALKDQPKGLSLGQIAERVGLPRSTVQRIIYALQAERFVMASSAEGGFRLGPEIQSLAEAGRINMAEVIRPVLAELAKQTGETVDLAVYRQDHMVFVDQVVGTHRLRTVSAVGETFPLSTTANGKAALALLSDDVAAALIARELGGQENKKRVLSDVIREVEEIRETGVAYDINEHTDGISAVGTAFKDVNGLIYAISVPVPSHRFDGKRDKLRAALVTAMDKVRANL
ncbi:IclR family transcriptional regulator [Nitratireductor sp. XY-223]|uniref:IclR family transcriptional regulator n=1 Tax=Nitratireductor sp. XY-223 TaxID=2561926 RepID=UPI0010A9DD41|nr:IclR family transcriptional regulator [Nitratireductor sp. XY-223]